MDLSRFPRVRLAHLPTRLERLPRLGAVLGGLDLWVKRDDCTGLAGGGNKTRKLEFLIADALHQGADTIVTAGGTQSNHVRQTVAAAMRLGLRADVVLERIHPIHDPAYDASGNLLLDRLLGAIVHDAPAGADVDAVGADVCARLRADGHKPYWVPVGGSNPVGALGYIGCGLELAGQLRDAGIANATIVHATGSTGTQAGLLTGLAAAEYPARIDGFCVSRPGPEQQAKVAALLKATLEFAGMRGAVTTDAVHCDGDHVGDGYGIPTPGMREALSLAARHEGLLLDPVYTGKAMAGLIAGARSGRYRATETVIFLHTGGQAALFSYLDSMLES